MNSFSFTGRLGRDVEVRYTPSGTPLASFSAANDVGFGLNKRTQWIKCNLWGKLAESGVIPYLTKGREVAVTGEVTLDEYTGRDGTPKASLSVRVSDLTLVGNGNVIQQEGRGTTKELWETETDGANSEFGDELPF